VIDRGVRCQCVPGSTQSRLEQCDGPKTYPTHWPERRGDTNNSRLVTRQETPQNCEASACMGWKSHAMEVGVGQHLFLAEDLAGLHEKMSVAIIGVGDDRHGAVDSASAHWG
jgi:hypothetical protein